jgi:hypothetical protein
LHTFRCFSATHHAWTFIQLAVIPPLHVLAIRHVAATDGRKPKRLGNGIQWHNVHTKFREIRPSRLNAAREDTQQLGDNKMGNGLSNTFKIHKPNRKEKETGNYFLWHTEISVISI